MKKNFALLCLLSLLSSPVLTQTSSTKQRALALTHVTGIDTTGGPAQPDITVVIRGDRIAAIGKSGGIPVPAGSEVLDATGKFLIPGLWDMNAFWYDQKDYLPLFIANGVTGVREMLGYSEHHELQTEVEAGQLLGPRMVIGTRWIEGPEESTDPWFIPVANESEARHLIIKAQEYGAQFIEVSGIETLPRKAFFALADEAKKRGIPLEGHVPVSVTVEEASNAGMKSIDPLTEIFDVDVGMLAACSSRETDLLKSLQEALAKLESSNQPNAWDALWAGPGFSAWMQLALDTYDQRKAEALFSLLRMNHTWLCPTLVAERNCTFFDDPSVAGDPRLKYMRSGARSWSKRD